MNAPVANSSFGQQQQQQKEEVELNASQKIDIMLKRMEELGSNKKEEEKKSVGLEEKWRVKRTCIHKLSTLAGPTPPHKPAFQHLLPHKPLSHTADRDGLTENR